MSPNRWGARVLLSLACTIVVSCGDGTDPSKTTAVTRTERVWVDASRRTPPTSRYAGAPTRTLRVLIWQPHATQPLPLFIMAHGFGGLPEKFDAFARTIASAGYVVAAPAFPLTNENAPGGHQIGIGDAGHQAGDLSFVITQLQQAAAEATDALGGRLRNDRVAVLGHSLGAATVIALTRKTCCRDERVQASIVVAAPLGLVGAFGGGSISSAGPPTLIMHGTADTEVAFQNAPDFYNMISPPRFLIGLMGGGHSDAVESQVQPPIATRDAAQRATLAFLDAVFEGATAELQRTVTALAAEGNSVEADPTP